MPIVFQIASLGSYYRLAFENMLLSIFGFARCGLNVESEMVEARDSLTEWLASLLGANRDSSSVDNLFVENIVKAIAGDFVAPSGAFRSSILNYYDIADGTLIINVLLFYVTIVALRVTTYAVVVLQAAAKR